MAPAKGLRPERRFRRRTVRVLVAFRAARGTDREGPRRAYATTLGAGGLFVECEDPPPVGAALRLRFRLEPTGAEHALDGRVVWIQPPDPPEPAAGETAAGPPRRVAGMGIEFTEPEERSRLARALERMPGGSARA